TLTEGKSSANKTNPRQPQCNYLQYHARPTPAGRRSMNLGSISVGSRADFEAMNRAIALHLLRPSLTGYSRLKRRRPHTATSRAAPICHAEPWFRAGGRVPRMHARHVLALWLTHTAAGSLSASQLR